MFGYMKNPDNKKQWIIDEPAAEIVRKIYDLCVDGKDPTQIAKILRKEKILTTKSYYAQVKGKPLPDNPYHWNENSVIHILERMEYTGCTVHFIREETLKKIVLSQIFEVTAMMYDNADKFFNLVAKQQLDEQSKEIQIIFNFIGEFTPQKEFIPDKKEIPQDYF